MKTWIFSNSRTIPKTTIKFHLIRISMSKYEFSILAVTSTGLKKKQKTWEEESFAQG